MRLSSPDAYRATTSSMLAQDKATIERLNPLQLADISVIYHTLAVRPLGELVSFFERHVQHTYMVDPPSHFFMRRSSLQRG
jgi:hypothetical protein